MPFFSSGEAETGSALPQAGHFAIGSAGDSIEVPQYGQKLILRAEAETLQIHGSWGVCPPEVLVLLTGAPFVN